MSIEQQVASTSERIRAAMDLRQMKQIDLVNKAGLDRSQISNYLSGKYEPKQKAINKLAVALDVSEMWLWGYDVPMERTKEQKNNDAISDIVVRMRQDEEFFSVVCNLNGIDKEKLKLISDMLNAFQK